MDFAYKHAEWSLKLMVGLTFANFAVAGFNFVMFAVTGHVSFLVAGAVSVGVGAWCVTRCEYFRRVRDEERARLQSARRAVMGR